MTHMPAPLDFALTFTWEDLPPECRSRVRLCLLDLVGIAIGGAQTRLSRIIRDHAHAEFGGDLPMLLDTRSASASGVALAAGMTIDALDGHDGYNPAKGHIGCPTFAGLWPLAHRHTADGRDLLTALAVGYEFGARVSEAQHATAPDYHTSGSWGAVTVAAAGARIAGLSHTQARHALGIAEYHGPRSQMMRCIDHPTMLKDGSGWGAMCGVSAIDLAARGFTGAPAITVEDAPAFWSDLGSRWAIMEQYFKPYPVCRWAQPPVESLLALRRQHDLTSDRVARIEVETFHESTRLATRRPASTEEAQYSTSFPCAIAMVRGGITPADISDDALSDPEILRLSDSMIMREADKANAAFPNRRLARTTLVLKDGTKLQSDWHEPRWDATSPPSEAELRTKFRSLAVPAVGADRATAIENAIDRFETTSLAPLSQLLSQPISPETTSGNSA